jgi:dienelactone hydrolase
VKRLIPLSVLAVLLVGLAVVWHAARVALLALLLLPAIFPSPPADPLSAVTAPPTRTDHRFVYSAGTVDVDIYHPASGGSHGGAVFLLGARPLPRRDPSVVRFAEALAREGVVVLIPESSNLLAGRVLPEETRALAMSFDLLASQPDVDPSRLGFVSFSVGGGLSIVAASQPALRDRVRFVNVLGGYFDAKDLLVDVASRSYVLDSRIVPWQPSPLTREVFAAQLVDTLPESPDRALLTRAFLQHEPVPDADWATLSPDGRTMRGLLDGVSRPAAQAAVDQLPPATRERLAAISPSSVIKDLRAHLYLMADQDDSFIPFVETRRLAAAAPPGTLQRVTDFSIFEHVVPDRPVPWQTFLPDLWALFWHVHAVLLEMA